MKRLLSFFKFNYMKIIIIVIGLTVLGYLFFIQYNYFSYGKKIEAVYQEITKIDQKLNELKEKKAMLDSTNGTDSKELADLQIALLKLQQDLNTANQKLKDLK